MCIYVLCMYVNIYICVYTNTYIYLCLYICFALIRCNHKWKNWIPELYYSMAANIALILISHCPLALAARRFPQPRMYLVSLASTHPFTWPFCYSNWNLPVILLLVMKWTLCCFLDTLHQTSNISWHCGLLCVSNNPPME